MACQTLACINEYGCVVPFPLGQEGEVLTIVGGKPVWQKPACNCTGGTPADVQLVDCKGKPLGLWIHSSNA